MKSPIVKPFPALNFSDINDSGEAAQSGLEVRLNIGQGRSTVPQSSVIEWKKSGRLLNDCSRAWYPKHAWGPKREILVGMLTESPKLERRPVTNPGKRGACRRQIQVLFELNWLHKPIIIKFWGTASSSGPEMGLGTANSSINKFRLHFVMGVALGGTRWYVWRPHWLRIVRVKSFTKVQRIAFTELDMLEGRGGSWIIAGREDTPSIILRSNNFQLGSCCSSSSVNWMLNTNPISNMRWVNEPKLPKSRLNAGFSTRFSREGGSSQICLKTRDLSVEGQIKQTVPTLRGNSKTESVSMGSNTGGSWWGLRARGFFLGLLAFFLVILFFRLSSLVDNASAWYGRNARSIGVAWFEGIPIARLMGGLTRVGRLGRASEEKEWRDPGGTGSGDIIPVELGEREAGPLGREPGG